ncbi:MAG: nucleotidyltransferase family protein [Pyrinomonadaceae bacterium]
MYLSDEDKQKIIEICRRNDVSYCAVFGSFARGEATAESDVDLLVKFSKRIGLFGFVGVEQELEKGLGRKVDLATDKMIGGYIRESVMRDLKIIYDETRQPATSSTYS